MRSWAARLAGLGFVACALFISGGAAGSIPPPEEEITEAPLSAEPHCNVPNPGKTTRDSEVVFGLLRSRARAHQLLRWVQRHGFRRARIEREKCKYEVAIIFLSRHRAERIARQARRRGFVKVTIAVS